jgi:hypothetical protein
MHVAGSTGGLHRHAGVVDFNSSLTIIPGLLSLMGREVVGDDEGRAGNCLTKVISCKMKIGV